MGADPRKTFQLNFKLRNWHPCEQAKNGMTRFCSQISILMVVQTLTVHHLQVNKQIMSSPHKKLNLD